MWTEDMSITEEKILSKKTICLVTKNMSVAGGAQRVTSLMAKELSSYYNVIVVSAMTDADGKIAYDFPENVKVIKATKGIKNQKNIKGSGCKSYLFRGCRCLSLCICFFCFYKAEKSVM